MIHTLNNKNHYNVAFI